MVPTHAWHYPEMNGGRSLSLPPTPHMSDYTWHTPHTRKFDDMQWHAIIRVFCVLLNVHRFKRKRKVSEIHTRPLSADYDAGTFVRRHQTNYIICIIIWEWVIFTKHTCSRRNTILMYANMRTTLLTKLLWLSVGFVRCFAYFVRHHDLIIIMLPQTLLNKIPKQSQWSKQKAVVF